ncbi:MAG: hypothetical protein R3B95_07865 [Nitrospirales bacterium]|nr:hypothetical protein [Nitrospirales bacterium]
MSSLTRNWLTVFIQSKEDGIGLVVVWRIENSWPASGWLPPEYHSIHPPIAAPETAVLMAEIFGTIGTGHTSQT